MNYTLLDLNAQLRAIGRGVVFYAAAAWDGATDLALTHLGDTEGDITAATNEEYSHLMLPELTGAAKHESYIAGEDPSVSIPLYYADPALRAIVSPTGNASGGYQRRRPVTTRTLVIFPEEMFFNAVADAYAALGYTGAGGWTIGGVALTAEQQRLMDISMWFWRGYFTKPGPVFKHTDGGKAVQTTNFQAMQSKLPLAVLPDGERLYTLGDPADAGIDIEPATV